MLTLAYGVTYGTLAETLADARMMNDHEALQSPPASASSPPTFTAPPPPSYFVGVMNLLGIKTSTSLPPSPPPQSPALASQHPPLTPTLVAPPNRHIDRHTRTDAAIVHPPPPLSPLPARPPPRSSLHTHPVSLWVPLK